MKQTKAGRIWLKESERKSWTIARLKKAIKRPSEVEVLFWNGEGESGEKIVGQEFCPCFENTTCSVSKANRKSCRKRKGWNSSKECLP